MKSFAVFRKNILKSVLALVAVMLVAGCIAEKNTDEKIHADFDWTITDNATLPNVKDVQFHNKTTSEHIDPSKIKYLWTFEPRNWPLDQCNGFHVENPKCSFPVGANAVTYTITLTGEGNVFIAHPTKTKELVIPGNTTPSMEAPAEIAPLEVAPSSDMEQPVQQENATATSEPVQ